PIADAPHQAIAQHAQARIGQVPVDPQQVPHLGRREAFGMLLEQGDDAPAHGATRIPEEGLSLALWHIRVFRTMWRWCRGRRLSWGHLGAQDWGRSWHIEQALVLLLHL